MKPKPSTKSRALVVAIILNTLNSTFVGAQSEVRRLIVIGATQFTAGALDGFSEVLLHRYNRFERRHPHANPRYWRPSESWVNKWRNGDPAQGERFPGSSTVFVWTTDAYHLARTGRNLTMRAGLVYAAVAARDQRLKPWQTFAIRFVVSSAAFSAGFHLPWSILYKQ